MGAGENGKSTRLKPIRQKNAFDELSQAILAVANSRDGRERTARLQYAQGLVKSIGDAFVTTAARLGHSLEMFPRITGGSLEAINVVTDDGRRFHELAGVKSWRILDANDVLVPVVDVVGMQCLVLPHHERPLSLEIQSDEGEVRRIPMKVPAPEPPPALPKPSA